MKILFQNVKFWRIPNMGLIMKRRYGIYLIVCESTFEGWHPVLVKVCISRSTETVFFLDIFDFRIKSRWACFSHHLHALITPTLYLGGGSITFYAIHTIPVSKKLNLKLQCSIIMKRKYTLLHLRISLIVIQNPPKILISS